MKRGFDFLRTKPLNETENIGEMESLYGLNLPPLYKIFSNIFLTGKYENSRFDGAEDGITICYPSFDFSWLSSSQESVNSLEFRIFFSLTSIFESWKNEISLSTDWEKYGLIDIGHCEPDSVRVLLGAKGDTIDQIWIMDWDCCVVEKPTKIATNIYEFVQMFKEPDKREIYYGEKLDRLYKKWNEDVWRVSPVPLLEE